jgi:4-hydroxy-3-methylbut-2-en-1-yl diphosphate synthase IspG/GcpE
VLISCPICARRQIDVAGLAEEVRAMIEGATAPIVVAVMGCEVNGPGEAREADVGIAGSRERAVIFRHGKVVRTVAGDEALAALREEVEGLLAESGDIRRCTQDDIQEQKSGRQRTSAVAAVFLVKGLGVGRDAMASLAGGRR